MPGGRGRRDARSRVGRACAWCWRPPARSRRFDRIYGVSAGALNGWATAAGQAALGATHYQDAVSRRVIDRTRALRGRPVIDFELLFEELIAARKPLSFERLSAGPEFRALATSLETMSLRVLQGFADADEVRQAVRASASLPRLVGEPPVFRGERMTDGGPRRADPVRDAAGARARPTCWCSARARRRAASRPLRPWASDSPSTRTRGCSSWPGSARASTTARRPRSQDGTLRCSPAPTSNRSPFRTGTRLIGRLEADTGRVVRALRLGAAAMASPLLTDAVSLCWQPVVYRAAAPVRCRSPRRRSPLLARAGASARRASGWSAAS